MHKLFALVRSRSEEPGENERSSLLRLAEVPGIQGMVISWPVQADEGGSDWAFGLPFPYGMVIEAWFEDSSSLQDAKLEIEAAVVGIVGDETDVDWVVAEELEVISRDRPPSGPEVKAIFFPNRLSEIDRSEFSEYWRTNHAEIVPNTPHLIRYIQSHPVGDSAVGLFDGVAELWWNNIDELEVALDSDAFTVEQAEDAMNFVDFSKQTGTVVQEDYVFGTFGK